MGFTKMFDQLNAAVDQVIASPKHQTFVTSSVIPGISNMALAKIQAIQGRTGQDMAISEFGMEAGKRVAELSDQVLKQTTTGKMDVFGDGITAILVLTESVNLDDLNINKNKGMLGSLTTFFKKKKTEVISQFQDTTTQIQKVVDELKGRQVTMTQDNHFLDDLYDANMGEYHDLGFSIEAVQYMLVDMEKEYSAAQQEALTSTDQFFIQRVSDMEQKLKRWEKQADRLKRMQHVALLTAPEIRGIQMGNVTMVEKFDDLVNTTVPAWKKQLSLTVVAMNQKANAELSTAMDEKTNQFFRRAAELNNSNTIAVAKTAERSTVDIETLAFMQQKMIDGVKQVKLIQENGKKERIAASDKIGILRDEMKKEMLSWK